MPVFRATTVMSVRHGGTVAIAGDGQVSIGQTVVKAAARKVRKLHHGRVVAGFAGAAADAFTLFARFEAKLEEHRGNLPARGGGAGQGLAHGPRAPAPRGAPRGGRRGGVVHRLRHRRRHRARRRPDRHRLGRALRTGRGPRAGGPLEPRRQRHRRAGAAHRGGHLRLHQRAHHRWRPCRERALHRRPQIVTELDRYIVGQHRAKRAVAIALRNRWRRQNLPGRARATRSRRRTSS